jgi:hypothetical protein
MRLGSSTVELEPEGASEGVKLRDEEAAERDPQPRGGLAGTSGASLASRLVVARAASSQRGEHHTDKQELLAAAKKRQAR